MKKSELQDALVELEEKFARIGFILELRGKLTNEDIIDEICKTVGINTSL
jgi:hypothetical protein